VTAADDLRARIEDGSVRIGVIGLGYVGLPLAVTAVERGLHVLGFDVDDAKIDRLREGDSYIRHLGRERVEAAGRSGRFEATADFSRLGEPDAIVVCVPTPLDPHREPDLSYVESTARAIADRLRPGQLVTLESTTYPGTTEEVMRPILEESGLACGDAFFLAYSPEREDPGNPEWSTSTIPKLVGGVDPASSDLAAALYGRLVDRVVRVPDARVAEAAKITENVFRGVNIALVNELKVIFARMGIDVWDVLDAAETKPFGFMRFDPGPGWGGHCIPVDPFYLSYKAREHGESARFIELAGEINRSVPEYVVERVVAVLNEAGLAVKGSRVLIVGLAFKPNVDDDRESPTYRLLDLLDARGAEVAYHDPHIPVVPPTREHARWAGLESVPWDTETIRAFDLVVIATHHADLEWNALGRWARRIVDTRNAMAGTDVDPAKVWKA